jgi:hypothetical protein
VSSFADRVQFRHCIEILDSGCGLLCRDERVKVELHDIRGYATDENELDAGLARDTHGSLHLSIV